MISPKKFCLYFHSQFCLQFRCPASRQRKNIEFRLVHLIYSVLTFRNRCPGPTSVIIIVDLRSTILKSLHLYSTCRTIIVLSPVTSMIWWSIFMGHNFFPP